MRFLFALVAQFAALAAEARADLAAPAEFAMRLLAAHNVVLPFVRSAARA